MASTCGDFFPGNLLISLRLQQGGEHRPDENSIDCVLPWSLSSKCSVQNSAVFDTVSSRSGFRGPNPGTAGEPGRIRNLSEPREIRSSWIFDRFWERGSPGAVNSDESNYQRARLSRLSAVSCGSSADSLGRAIWRRQGNISTLNHVWSSVSGGVPVSTKML